MNQETWAAVDRYISDSMIPPDPVLQAALGASEAAGLPAISVSPAQGKFLHLLARIKQARHILEIGTLGGYSTIWLARALPADGRLVTLELDPKHAEVARRNFQQAGLAGVIELQLGRAANTLDELIAGKTEAFDLIFIDADKASIADYFTKSLRLARPGTVIVVDNVVRGGAVADATSTDISVQGVRRLNALVAAESRVTATSLQTVGSKGYDGFTLLLVTAT